ncbi:MAG: HAMP domain-containing histidine kinase, partial [Phycisphaerae bacterium]|nr:HAMP domain-containing histidine kinase [Phycisphaerae bacterium]
HESRPSDSATEAIVPARSPRSFTEGELVGVISVVIPAGQTNTTLLFNLLTIIMGGAFSCISAAVVFYLFTQRFIIQPVRSLRQAADQVTLSSDNAVDDSGQEMKAWDNALAITENIKTGDEFEKMANAFHQMLTRLKLAHDRLRETNRALDMRLGELETRNIALYESNKLKTEFLANVSHELRTPLNAIIGFAEILKDQAEQRNDDRNSRYSNNVLESGNMLLGIINDLLELATIEAGKVEIHWESIPFEETLEAILNLTRPQFAEKNLHVITSIDESTGRIETDTGKLQQILFNLFSNAIKFTPAEGTVEISARKYVDPQQRAMLEIIVADNGKGIAEEDREKIFEKFLQLDGSVTREYTGVGLGLAIVKELTAILNGTISVGGQVGQGAIFTLTLPVARQADQ